MTDRSPSPDELASELLDLLLTDPAAAAGADEALVARAGDLRAAREALRAATPPAPDAQRREQAIAAALGAADGVVVPMVRPSSRPSTVPARRPWAFAAVGAVAAGLLALIGFALLRDDRGPTSGTALDAASTTAAARASNEDSGGLQSGGGAPADASAPTTLAPATLGSIPATPPAVVAAPTSKGSDVLLGAANTPEELRHLLLAARDGRSGFETAAPDPLCPAVEGARIGLVVWQGHNAVVHETVSGWVVRSVPDCLVLVEVPLT